MSKHEQLSLEIAEMDLMDLSILYGRCT